mgnify:CR=1 FL=1
MKKLLLLLFLPLLLISCPKDDPNGDPGELLAEAEIGPAGGTLETEEFTLTVPPGTFTETQSLRLYAEEVHTEDFGGNTVTPVYRVTGIPAVTSGPMTVRIQYDGTLEEESHVAMGGLDEMLESEEEEAVYALYPATESAGWLEAEIPVLPGEAGAEELKSALFWPELSFLLYAVSDMNTQSAGYFKIRYPSGISGQKIQQLAGYLDDAMQACFDMKLVTREGMDAGIQLSGTPVVVVTNKNVTGSSAYLVQMPWMSRLAKDDDGLVMLARLPQYTGIRVNLSRSALEDASANELKAACHMWVYRMVYFLYFGDYMDWFAYASALYMKEKFAGVSEYTPALFPVVGMSPFTGMEAGKELYTWGAAMPSNIGGRILHHEKYHAMGMYPFVKYLDQHNPDDKELFIRIIREIIQSESGKPMEGIIHALGDANPEYDWWPGFFEKYLTRELADITAEQFLNTVKSLDEIEFDQEKDAEKSSSADYADLSARLYRVKFTFPSFENEASLNLKLESSELNLNYITAMAFGLKGEVLEYFDHASNLTIEKLKTLHDNGTSSILVAVVNSASSPSTDDRLNIDLDTRLQTKPKDFVSVNIDLGCRTNVTFESGSSGETYFNYYIPSGSRSGEMFDYSFRATWDEYVESLHYTGTIEVEFDPARYPFYINQFSVIEDNQTATGESITITGENIELTEFNFSFMNEHYFKFSAYGTDVCTYITGVDKITRNSEGVAVIYGDGFPICNTSSYFTIQLDCGD